MAIEFIQDSPKGGRHSGLEWTRERYQPFDNVIYNDSPPSFGGIISTERSRYWNVSRKRFWRFCRM